MILVKDLEDLVIHLEFFFYKGADFIIFYLALKRKIIYEYPSYF